MIKRRNAVAALMTVTLLSTLNSAVLAGGDSEPAEPTGIEWTLTSITTEGSTTAVPEGVLATLRLDAGAANGSGGCNSFFSDYVIDGRTLSFGPIGATKKFCEGPEQGIEDAYLAALGSVAYWDIDENGSLSLQDEAQTELLSFSAATGGIEGISWLLRWQAVGDTQAEVPDGILVSLRMEDGEAGGNGGCNSYSTSYTIDGASITFGRIASTLMACQESASSVESDYLANLASVATWDSDGATLTFGSAAGFDLLQYEAAPQGSIVGSWIAQGINNGSGGVVSSTMTSEVTADFSADGKLTGFDGCNDYFTTYQVDGDAIDISEAI
ncbi:MAG: META domain-containing protein, partial [Chloroflexota bacterium]